LALPIAVATGYQQIHDLPPARLAVGLLDRVVRTNAAIREQCVQGMELPQAEWFSVEHALGLFA
jgi:hypothetical protein